MAKYGDALQATTSTEGTGDITLADVAKFIPFSARYSDTDPVPYAIENPQSGSNSQWEIGQGRWLTGNILERTTPQVTWDGTTWDASSPSPITLSGDSLVYGTNTAANIDAPTVDSLLVNDNGDVTLGGTGQINLPQVNDASNPTIDFGGFGFYAIANDRIGVSINGNRLFEFDSDEIRTAKTTGPSMINEEPSSINPTSLPNNTDKNTGVGHAAADALSLIAGGIEALRLTEVSSTIHAILYGTELIQGKVDIGIPGTGAGLDIGEGGSYSADAAGSTIVEAYSYDASASSGSRFTALTITANNTLLADSGDRIYFGSPNKFWAARVAIGVANSASDETLLGFYWNGSALTSIGYMGVLKDSSTSLADRILEQTTESEYIAIGVEADADWAATDDQLDEIPNSGSSLYWFCLQVPVSGLTTAPRIDDIKVRGTDVDFATGTSQLVQWGKARSGKHQGVTSFIQRASAQPSLSDEAISTNVQRPLYVLRNNQSDGVDASFRLPADIDTSCKVGVTLDWFGSATGEVDFDLYWKFLKQATVIGSGEPDTGTSNTLITPSAAAAFQEANPLLTSAQLIDISALGGGDLVLFSLVRDGTADANAGSVFPIELIIHYTSWSSGELV